MFMPLMLNGHKKFHRGERRGFAASLDFMGCLHESYPQNLGISLFRIMPKALSALVLELIDQFLYNSKII